MKSIQILLCLVSFSTFAQKMPDDFTLLAVIQAKDLIFNAPSDIMFNEDLSLMIISYSFKPTYLVVYDTKKWELFNHVENPEWSNQVEAPGWLYLGNSYFDCTNAELLYAYYNNNKYTVINILSGFTQKIKTKDLPTEKCGHVFKGDPILREQKFLVKDRFFVELKHESKTILVSGKRVKKTK